ncbi:zinc finger protein 511 isoform X5 [Tenrec ecaudatus]|uniref:zinc finger protein 511 isoform X5 n=1 Tax=Tenrec ecaudatus TaxID=94439 RepID=UPI003F597EBD
MQLPPALGARLAKGPGAAEPLPVERDPVAGKAPFRFAARRVRFPREHEFFEDGDVQRHLYLQDVLTQVAEAPERPRVREFPCQVAGCQQVFHVLEAYEHHYHTQHANVCSVCKRTFPSSHLLDSHLLEWHDTLFLTLAERQDMVVVFSFQYQCLVGGCEEKFRTSRDRKEHMVACHLYPVDFRFDRPKKSKGQRGALGGSGWGRREEPHWAAKTVRSAPGDRQPLLGRKTGLSTPVHSDSLRNPSRQPPTPWPIGLLCPGWREVG